MPSTNSLCVTFWSFLFLNAWWLLVLSNWEKMGSSANISLKLRKKQNASTLILQSILYLKDTANDQQHRISTTSWNDEDFSFTESLKFWHFSASKYSTKSLEMTYPNQFQASTLLDLHRTIWYKRISSLKHLTLAMKNWRFFQGKGIPEKFQKLIPDH